MERPELSVLLLVVGHSDVRAARSCPGQRQTWGAVGLGAAPGHGGGLWGSSSRHDPEQLNTTTREAVHVNGGGPETFFFSFTLNVFSVISVLKALIKL